MKFVNKASRTYANYSKVGRAIKKGVKRVSNGFNSFESVRSKVTKKIKTKMGLK